jgi:hypothetical protein
MRVGRYNIRFLHMMIRLFQRLKLWAPMARRCIAILCALAIISVSVAHGVQHFNAPVTGVVIQADLSPADDGANTAMLAVDHCIGCSMSAMAAILFSLIPELAAADLPTFAFNEYRPHTPAAETPPPKSSI